LYRSTLKIHGLKKDNYQISYANDSMKLNSNNTITDYCDQRVNYDCYLRHFFQIYTKISLQANEPRIEFGTPQEEKIASKYPLFMTYFKEELAGDSLFMDYSQRDDAGVNKITYEPENQWISFSRTRLDGHVTSSNLYEAEGRSFERAIKAYVGANKRRVDIASQIKKRSGLDIIKVYENERMEILWNGEKISYGQSRIYFSDRPGSATFLFDMPFPSIKNISKEEFTHLMNLAKRAYEVVSQIPNMAYPPEHVSIKKDIQQAHVYVKLLPGEKASERFIQVHNRTITVPIGKSFEIDLVTKTYKEAQ
jgi:hypothetical protein